MANDSGNTRLIRLPAVIDRTGLSRTSIHTRIAIGDFPRPVPLGVGVAVASVKPEVDQWVARQIERRDSATMLQERTA